MELVDLQADMGVKVLKVRGTDLAGLRSLTKKQTVGEQDLRGQLGEEKL